MRKIFKQPVEGESERNKFLRLIHSLGKLPVYDARWFQDDFGIGDEDEDEEEARRSDSR